MEISAVYYLFRSIGEPQGQRPYSLTPEIYGQFLIDLFQLWYKDWRRGKAPYIRQFENYVGILLGYPPESCEQRGICSVQCVTEADGSVYPCDFYVMDAYRLGNFNNDPITDFFERKEAKQFVEESKNGAINVNIVNIFRFVVRDVEEAE